MMCIETERMLMREFSEDDAMGMFELDSDPMVQKYIGNIPISTLSEAVENINFIRNQYLTNGIGRFALIEKITGSFLGWGGLKLITHEINQHKNFYELGYRLMPKYWGKGFATEASRAWVDYGFKQLQLQTIYAIADIENQASYHVLNKVGFKLIDIFDHEEKPHYWLVLTNSIKEIKTT